MKLLQTFVMAGLLAGTACQSVPPKPENVSVEPESLASTSSRADADNPAIAQLDPTVRRLKESLSLTEQQTQELDKIYKEYRAKQKVLIKELQDLNKKRLEQINAVLTHEQQEKFEQGLGTFPEHPGQPGRSPEP
jgi:Spy/CpxP family protein refolding chaperone